MNIGKKYKESKPTSIINKISLNRYKKESFICAKSRVKYEK